MESHDFPGRALGRLVIAVNRTIDWIGRITSVLIFALIGVLLYGVIMRYVFGRPTLWAGELSGLLYAVYFLVGGSYALVHGAHVRVNIFRQKLSPRTRAVLDLATWSLFYLFIGVIFWLGIGFAWTAIERLERSPTAWGPYIWPVKMFLPISASMMLLVGITKTVCDSYLAWTGRPLVEVESDKAVETSSSSDAQH